VYRLRTKLIAAFVVATLLPLAATIWIARSLIDRSLGYATTGDLDRLSRTLEDTARRFYQREREALSEEVAAGRVPATRLEAARVASWPEPVRAFWDSGEPERFILSGRGGDHLDLLRRVPDGVAVYRRDLGGVHLQDVSAEFGQTRELVGVMQDRDLRRGFTLTLLLLIAAVWLVSLAPLIFIAHSISRPIQQLTAGLTDFAGGDWNQRLGGDRTDEVGRAVQAFNRMADELRGQRDRLVYLTQMSSWQTLARKTAHELKNSLTPIRLTVEEMLARQAPADRAFMEQAAQIVISEIEALERWVRAFSEFASDPPVAPARLDLNALVQERVSLLQLSHPETSYQFRLDGHEPCVYASPDLVRSILTNLLENAAEAAGRGGSVLTLTRREANTVVVEIHDSGPGLSPEAAATLFEPSITFKKHGMGLGLSIARKNALVSGGDVTVVAGELPGAAFRVTLPRATDATSAPTS
jgi:nitrogen fixation/metabolism regulation signal transduction histidine kinase